ncbi:hypothetical protein KAU08_06290 [bacterium]|nr:hypothetical protein [bacterium]
MSDLHISIRAANVNERSTMYMMLIMSFSGIISLMDNNQGKNRDENTPHWIWGLAIALWTALVYVLFFVNFIHDFLDSRGV